VWERLPVVLPIACWLAGLYLRALGLRWWSWAHVVLLAGSFAFLLIAPAKLHSAGAAGDPSCGFCSCWPRRWGCPTSCCPRPAPAGARAGYVREPVAGRPGESPWRLYALSNFGSFLACQLSLFRGRAIHTSATRDANPRTWLYGAFVGVRERYGPRSTAQIQARAFL